MGPHNALAGNAGKTGVSIVSVNGRFWPKAAIDLIHSYPRDIGSHIENMVSYVTGLEIDSLCARLDKILN